MKGLVIFYYKIMKKNILSIFLALLSTAPSMAQLNGDGFYRIQNVTTGRYMTLCDNHSKGVNVNATTAEVGALETRPSYENVVSDPGSIFYIKHIQNDDYNIFAQGADMHALTEYYIKLTYRNAQKAYLAHQSSNGYDLRLQDEIKNCGTTGNSYVTTVNQNDIANTQHWKITPVSTSTSNYIGITPNVSANGKYYTLYYTGFDYNLVSPGMKAYYVSKVDESKAVVVYKEITGTIPAKTPVVIECNSKNPADNKIMPMMQATKNTYSNKLVGVFFSTGNLWSGHYNSIVFNEGNMRTLGSKNNKVVFNTSTELLPTVEVCLVPNSSKNEDYEMKKCIGPNTAYIEVSASTAKELNWMSETDYITASITNPNTNDSYPADIYDLNGNLVKKNATSTEGLAKGVYIYKGKKLVVS